MTIVPQNSAAHKMNYPPRPESLSRVHADFPAMAARIAGHQLELAMMAAQSGNAYIAAGGALAEVEVGAIYHALHSEYHQNDPNACTPECPFAVELARLDGLPVEVA